MLREDLAGQIDKSENSLLKVSVDTFAGFIFLNPDPDAQPLAEFLGPEVAEMLAPYHLDEMVTVMDVREPLDCNWKVVMDAFQEGYHIHGIHPQLAQRARDRSQRPARYRFFENHSVAVAPFEVTGASAGEAGRRHHGPSRDLPVHRGGTSRGSRNWSPNTAPRTAASNSRTTSPPAQLLQQATRDTLTGMGLDVSGLTDTQMSDNHGWVLFPNFFMTIRAGECHVIMARTPSRRRPEPMHLARQQLHVPASGAPRRLPRPLTEVDEPGSYKYFEALQQDYEQMPRQQKGLRNSRLDHMSLVKEEVVIGHYHSVVDRYMTNAAGGVSVMTVSRDVGDVIDGYTGHARTVLDYSVVTKHLVDEAKQAGVHGGQLGATGRVDRS